MTTVDIDLGKYSLGWADSEADYIFKPKKGLNEEIIREMSRDQERAGVDAPVPPQGLLAVPPQAGPDLGWWGNAQRDRLRRHLLLHQADGGPGQGLGHGSRLHQGHLREAGHPPSRAEVPRRCHRPVRVRGRLPPQPRRPRGPRRAVHGHGHGGARVPGDRPGVLRDDHPAERQQVRRAQLGGVVGRLVHLRAARACTSTSRSRPTSGSTPRTWVSSSGR